MHACYTFKARSCPLPQHLRLIPESFISSLAAIYSEVLASDAQRSDYRTVIQSLSCSHACTRKYEYLSPYSIWWGLWRQFLDFASELDIAQLKSECPTIDRIKRGCKSPYRCRTSEGEAHSMPALQKERRNLRAEQKYAGSSSGSTK